MRRIFYLGVLIALLLPAIIFISGCLGGEPQPQEPNGIEEPGGIEGTVTDTDNKPVVGMTVFIVSGTTGFPEIAPITNDVGYYAIGSVPPGTFEVAVHDQEGNKVSQEGVVVQSGQTSSLNFTIPAETPAEAPPSPELPKAEEPEEPTPTPEPTSVEAEISGFTFVPDPITIPVGTSVTWTNQDSAAHTVTSETGLFDSGRLALNASLSHSFTERGTFSYFCTIHPYMKGKVIVE